MKICLRRVLWLVLPVVVLAGALWLVKEMRPVDIDMSREKNCSMSVMLKRLSKECARHHWAATISVEQSNDYGFGNSFSFDRRKGWFFYSYSGRQSREWRFSSVRDEDVRALLAATKAKEDYEVPNAIADILHKRGCKLDGKTTPYDCSGIYKKDCQ